MVEMYRAQIARGQAVLRCRREAAHCRTLAAQASNKVERANYERLARNWDTLADTRAWPGQPSQRRRM